MLAEIRSLSDGKVLWSGEVKVPNGESLYLRGAKLGGAKLGGADLGGANLYCADLGGADLRGAKLGGADLRGAKLGGADLRVPNLYGADLRVPNLYGADLRGANLYGAYLRGADLRGATIPTGETWEQYLDSVVPAFLTAGGKRLEEVATEEHWNCHDWNNCPTAAAFPGCGIEAVPVLLRPRAEQFIQFFDARLIPRPVVTKDKAHVAS